VNLRLIVLLFALSFCATGRAADPLKVTGENYNKVVIGSNTQFVYKCLGRETSISFHDAWKKPQMDTTDATVVIRSETIGWSRSGNWVVEAGVLPGDENRRPNRR